MESPASRDITPLAQPDHRRLRSAVSIPTFPQILNELIQNSLDAGATRIESWISLEKANEMIRVEDDGDGVERDGLNYIGRAPASSKDRTNTQCGPTDTYGFRGEALASISSLGLLEITSKTARSRQTFTKVIKNGRAVFTGLSNRAIAGRHGTSVSVKDIFHNIPVRHASLTATPPTTIVNACRKVIESLALVRPGVKWVLWEDRPSIGTATGGPKKIIGINGGKTSAEVYRSIYGNALTERVQNIRVSSDGRRIDGFISLCGAISQTSQHLYVNHFPIDRTDIHLAIAKRFAVSRFSKMTQDDIETPDINYCQRRSPRRLERYPIYVLDVTLPAEEVDLAYGPKKRILGYRDIDTVKSFVLAVVDQFLKRHGFLNKKEEGLQVSEHSPLRKGLRTAQERSARSPARSQLRQGSQSHHDSGSVRDRSSSGRQHTRIEDEYPRSPSQMPPPQLVPHKRLALSNSEDPSRRKVTPSRREVFEGSGLAGDEVSRGRLTVESSGKRHRWIEDIVAGVHTGVMPCSPSACHIPTTFKDRLLLAVKDSTHPKDHHHSCSHTLSAYDPTSDIAFTTESLANATILGQVDTKFIACLLHSPTQPRTLVLIDQHAADERVAVEAILQELCEGFMSDTIRQSEVSGPAIVLTRSEAQRLASSTFLEIFARWGISLELEELGEGDYVQVPIKAVPTILASRLARKEASEMTRLVRLWLDHLDETHDELQWLISKYDNGEVDDWQRVQRWMPKEMLELANSKACRNAIMFQDPLDLDQCKRLVYRLSKARSPWICAHGRPSIVPLGSIGQGQVGVKRKINWTNFIVAS